MTDLSGQKKGLLLIVFAAVISLTLLFFRLSFSLSESRNVVCPEDLGVVLSEDDQSLYVLAVQDQSAADNMGLCPGDEILAYNDTPVSSSEDLCALFSGQAGSSDYLLLKRNGKHVRAFFSSGRRCQWPFR